MVPSMHALNQSLGVQDGFEPILAEFMRKCPS